jgi:glycosyltransferase involved in cell wall biosynthesis
MYITICEKYGNLENILAGLYYSDYHEFTTCVYMLLSYDSLRARLVNEGKTYVRDNYNWDRVERKYVELFEKVRTGVLQ